MATRPLPVDIVRSLLISIDGYGMDSAARLIAPDVHFRFRNADPTDTRLAFIAYAQTFLAAISAIRHDVIDIWQVDHATVVTVLDVHYSRHDGKQLNLACCSVFRVVEDLVREYRIYTDANPVTEESRSVLE